MLNRMTEFSWNGGVTPGVTFTDAAASRLTSVTDMDANNVTIVTISRSYFNDNLLSSQTESVTGGVQKYHDRRGHAGAAKTVPQLFL